MSETHPLTDTLQRLRQRFVDRRETLAVAESVTSGMIQSMIGSVSGASDYFVGGVVAYNLQQKVRQLGVSHDHAAQVNCVSQQVAAEMARGVGGRFDVSFAAATTGYAEPDPLFGVATPMAYLAVWKNNGNGEGEVIRSEKWTGQGGRTETRTAIATKAIELLLEAIEVAR
jgi:nicotinamide-nucleotide amidase